MNRSKRKWLEPYAAGIALLSMPFGGSLFALLAAFLICIRASDEANSRKNRLIDMDQPQKL